jgi:hypothetical protein
MADSQDPSSSQVPGGSADAIVEHDGAPHECLEWCPICRTADVLRAGASPEMRDQWEDIQREALATLRVVIDHYSRRLDQEAAENAAPDEPPRPE